MSIGKHHSHNAGTVEWLTPPEIIAAVGGYKSLDRDPCAPIVQPYPTALRTHTILDDGLAQDWGDDRVWLNPPYANGEIEKWLEKMALHNRGTALIFARTETDAFFRFIMDRASGLFFMKGRIHFHVGEAFSELKWIKGRPAPGKTFLPGDRAKGNAGAPTVLAAYGQEDLDILAACNLEGRLVVLRLQRSVLVERITGSWVEELSRYLDEHDGPVDLQDLYRAFADHPKAKANRNWKPKIRQSLQRGAGVRVAKGKWSKKQ